MIPGLLKRFRRRPTLPHSCPCSTIGAEELNFRVRDGNGCDLFAIATENSIYELTNLCQDTKHLNIANILMDHANYFVAKPHDRLVPVS